MKMVFVWMLYGNDRKRKLLLISSFLEKLPLAVCSMQSANTHMTLSIMSSGIIVPMLSRPSGSSNLSDTFVSRKKLEGKPITPFGTIKVRNVLYVV